MPKVPAADGAVPEAHASCMPKVPAADGAVPETKANLEKWRSIMENETSNDERKKREIFNHLKLFDINNIESLKKTLLKLPPKGKPLTYILDELKMAFENGYSCGELSEIAKQNGIIVSPRYLQKILSFPSEEKPSDFSAPVESEARRGVIKTNFGDI